MWYRDEELYPRFLRSVLWMTVIQGLFVSSCTFVLKVISWQPVYNFVDFVFCIFHWKTILYQCFLAGTIIAFGVQNIHYCAVEKHISATRFEKLCRALSFYCLQNVIGTMLLGGVGAYCCIGHFNNFIGKSSLLDISLSLNSDFEFSFISGHGCFTGLMFSLKYFICNMYLMKFTLTQESKVLNIQLQLYDLLKESFFCVLKAIHWYYLGFMIFGSPLNILTLSYVGNTESTSDSIYYNLLNPKLFLATISSGVIISFMWSLYIIIFNAFVTERCVFPIKTPVKGKKITLTCALTSNDLGYIKYLGVMDLRLLSQYEISRREEIYAISNPGGHPHEWKAISQICLTSLQDFVIKLYEYSFSAAAASSKSIPPKKSKLDGIPDKVQSNIFEKAVSCVRQKPVVAYFFDELPNAKLMKLFATAQPIIWMIDALGYLVAFSYAEDKFGVVQQSLPDIIRILLDLKMAEEKMPIGLVGIRTYVKDPQGRYEHIHQRLSLKATVNNALCRIAGVLKDDIKGIYLPEEYKKYLQRYSSSLDSYSRNFSDSV